MGRPNPEELAFAIQLHIDDLMQSRCKYILGLFAILGLGCGEDAALPQGEFQDSGPMVGDAGPVEVDAGPALSMGTPWNFEGEELRAQTQLTDGNRAWVLRATDGRSQLSIELYEAYGSATEAGTVALTETEGNYATCGTCIVLQTGCEAHGSHFHCDATFMPRAEGNLRIDALGAGPGERLAGELQQVVFREVTIAEDYTTSPVSEGELLELNSWSFDAVLEAPEEPGPECSGHGHQHGSACHCDPGYRNDPEDPTRCIPE